MVIDFFKKLTVAILYWLVFCLNDCKGAVLLSAEQTHLISVVLLAYEGNILHTW